MNQYTFENNSPKSMVYGEYHKKVMEKYEKLLQTKGDQETVFQKFFEKNPTLVPGARSSFFGAASGHPPYMKTLITQPRIRGLEDKIPDFMWLSYDSSVFSPVLIEIEAPNKRLFTQKGTQTAKFTQALDQIKDWKVVLSNPVNVLNFYNDFSIPENLRQLNFEPYYVLIYGRRSEFEDNPLLIRKRSQLTGSNEVLMSFDRINPSFPDQNHVCSRVKAGIYEACSLDPTLKIGPSTSHLLEFSNIVNAVDNMDNDFVTLERRVFLKKRIPYWNQYHRDAANGIKVEIEFESGEWQTEE